MGSRLFFDHSLCIFEQFTQVFFNDALHDAVVNTIIAVSEDMPERHDIMSGHGQTGE